MGVELTYGVINTEQRQLLSYCLDAIARERGTVDFETETLVLDNCSSDGSVAAARAHLATTEVIVVAGRRTRPENASALLQRARGRFCLLLNEAAELEPGATAALHEALASAERGAAAGATLVRPDGALQPSAWRFPSRWTAMLSLVGLERRLVVQSQGDRVREVDWMPAAALLVRREAARAVGWVQRDEVEFCRRLRAAGWCVLYVPEARAVHHEEL
jgi:N-acetylglucosaminyl-diphospho-decaprenol L-rhamnosyltransferase